MTKLQTTGSRAYLHTTMRLAVAVVIAIAAVVAVPHSVFAQAKAARKGGEKKPKFEDVTLTTKDGVF